MGITATGRRRNDSWPEALKREIVAATFAPGASVSVVARHYDVNANQVFSWRKRYRDDPCAPAGRSAPQLIPVTVTAETAAVATAPSTVTETIEIDLAGKYRVRVGNGVDAQALRRVTAASSARSTRRAIGNTVGGRAIDDGHPRVASEHQRYNIVKRA
jgi:transposase